MTRGTLLIFPLILASLLPSCGDSDPNMRRQPRTKPFRASAFFPDGASARPLPAHVVARDDSSTSTDSAHPRPDLTLNVLIRGQQRFDIYCSMCHGRDGYGRGMVALRGFPQPPSFHAPDILAKSDDHYFQVISQGLGKMPPYARMVPVSDRWAIVDYIRALQRSQHAQPGDAPPDQLSALNQLPTGGGRP